MNAQVEGFAVTETHHPYTTMKDSGMKDTTPTLPTPATYDSSSPLRRRNRSRRRCILSTCCLLFLALVLIIGLGVLIEWLIIQPKDGNYDLQDAQLQTFKLTRNGTESYDLDTDMNLKFLFTNPNHMMGFDIKGFNVHSSYAGVEIGESADVPPFYQGKRNDTIVPSEIQAVKSVLAETVGDGLQGEIGRNNVTLLVVMNAKVRNDHHMLKALHPYRGVHLTCFVNLMSPNGSAPGNLISKSCSVKRD